MKKIFVRFTSFALVLLTLLLSGCADTTPPQATEAPTGSAATEGTQTTTPNNNNNQQPPSECQHNYVQTALAHKCGEGNTITKTCSLCNDVQTTIDTSDAAKAHEYVGAACKHCGAAVVAGTLIYAEDFEGISNTSTSAQVIEALGWKLENQNTGAYFDNTASYTVVKDGENNRLFINNNSANARDSYVRILNDTQFGAFHRNNYTYQYDLTYSDGASNDRYIALVSEYNGGAYNSFHVRVAGHANNEAHVNAQNGTYAWAAYSSESNANSPFVKLTGNTYGSSTFKDMSISIRYVVDWENGNSIYMRLNDKGYANTDKWILVTKYDETKGSEEFWTPDIFGASLAIKARALQNGYIDNIYVWAGTHKDIVEGEGKGIINAQTEECSGHTMKHGVCMYCGKEEDKMVLSQVVAELTKDGVKQFNATVDKLMQYPTISGYPVTQGGCTDGTYVYIVFAKSDYSSAKILKFDPKTWEVVQTSEPLQLDHGNDLTYNSKTGKLICTHAAPNYKTISIINPTTLAVESTKTDLAVDIFGIAYDKINDRYAAATLVTNTQNEDISVLDSSFNLVDTYVNLPLTGYTTQGIVCDDKYIYALFYRENIINIYDWDGNFVARVDITGIATAVKSNASDSPTPTEPEYLYILDGELYLGCHSHYVGNGITGNAQVFKITFEK